ncbi:MAG: biotin--[acetyl-CoA-carboxylase] ligase [Limnothrix sp.]
MTPEAISSQLRAINARVAAVEIFEEIDSTNKLLWARFAENAVMPRVAIARRQTAGRGQWGKNWVSAAGGLYLSVLLPLEIEPQNAYSLTIASAWGIAAALRQNQIPVQIKWANDLLLNNKKLGGIKTETKVQQGKITAAVIGVGINYTNSVPDVGISLKTFWRDELQFSGDRLAALVIASILNATEKLAKESIHSILPDYLALLKNMGETVVYEGHQGVIVGVSEKGELLLKLSAAGSRSIIKIPPGQVSLGYGT